MMKGRVRLSKMSLGVLAAVIMAAVVVSAAVIFSAQVEREQSVFTALELTVTPDVFPDLVTGVNSTTTQAVEVNVTNPAGNPTVNGIRLTVTLVAVQGCSTGSVNENGTNLCLGPLTTTPFILNAGETRLIDLLFEYSPTFAGVAAYTFQAEGTT